MTLDFLLARIAAGDQPAADGPLHPRRDGRRRDPRPARRRLPSLRDRSDLARPPLRADALRQRPAGPDVSPRVGAHRRRALPRGRDRRPRYLLRELRRDGRDVRREPGCRHRRRRGRDVHLDCRRDPRRARRRAPALFAAAYGVRARATGRADDPVRRRAGARSRRAIGIVGRRRRATRLAEARARLLDRRGERPQPARDDKALAAWNGLAIGALADAARLLGRGGSDAAQRYRDGAIAAADAILAGLRGPDGRLGARGRTAARPARASSRTTPISPTACSPCTRRPSTSAGSSRPGSSRTRSSTTSPTRPAASSTRPTTTKRSSRDRRTRRTTRRRPAARWRRVSSSGLPP